MTTVVAVDQGTTATKTGVMDNDHNLSVISNLRHRQIYPRTGWVEHNPEELLDNIKNGINLAKSAGIGKLDAIGIDNQGETVVAWDGQTGTPICNAIVWQDYRTQNEIEKLQADGAEELTQQRAGMPLDPYFSASKMKWILDNVSDAKPLLRSARLRIGTSDAYFLDRLTGEYATDISTASRTSLMNIETGQWDEELCKLFGVPVEVLPEIRPTTGNFGEIKAFNCPVLANVVDQQAALFGHACIQSGDTKITFGTGAFALANTGSKLVNEPDQGFLPTVAWQIGNQSVCYAIDAGLYTAGAAIDWLIGTSLAESVEALNSFPSKSAISKGLVFVPALSGLGCPYWERTASALWLGMKIKTSKQELCQSVVEGVALRSGQLIDKLSEIVDIPDTLPIDGGLSSNPYFCQFFADVVQRQVVVPSTSEITAFGTAKLALMSLNDLNGNPDATQSVNSNYQAKYEPGRSNMQEEKERFAAAVDRCRNWNLKPD